jgi:VanZ family protein
VNTPPPAPTWRLRLAAFALFEALLAVWTWKLLEPNPVPEPVISFLSLWALLPFLAAKCLHLSGYALLAALAWTWAPNRPARRALVVFLLLHGVGTEIGQTLVPNRTGKARDVVIDWFGIAGGSLAARRYWRQTGERGASAP